MKKLVTILTIVLLLSGCSNRPESYKDDLGDLAKEYNSYAFKIDCQTFWSVKTIYADEITSEPVEGGYQMMIKRDNMMFRPVCSGIEVFKGEIK